MGSKLPSLALPSATYLPLEAQHRRSTSLLLAVSLHHLHTYTYTGQVTPGTSTSTSTGAAALEQRACVLLVPSGFWQQWAPTPTLTLLLLVAHKDLRNLLEAPNKIATVVGESQRGRTQMIESELNPLAAFFLVAI